MILFFIYYIALRRRKLPAIIRARPYLVVLYCRSSGNRSERSSRTVSQGRKTLSKNRYITLVGLVEKSPGVSKADDYQ